MDSIRSIWNSSDADDEILLEITMVYLWKVNKDFYFTYLRLLCFNESDVNEDILFIRQNSSLQVFVIIILSDVIVIKSIKILSKMADLQLKPR